MVHQQFSADHCSKIGHGSDHPADAIFLSGYFDGRWFFFLPSTILPDSVEHLGGGKSRRSTNRCSSNHGKI